MAASERVDGRPVGLWERAGAVAVGVEVAILLVGTGILVASWISDGAESPAFSAVLVVFALAIAAGLVAVARGTWRGKRWPRGAALTWQLLHLSVAFGSRGIPAWLLIVLVVPAAVALAGIVSGAMRANAEAPR